MNVGSALADLLALNHSDMLAIATVVLFITFLASADQSPSRKLVTSTGYSSLTDVNMAKAEMNAGRACKPVC